MTERTARTLIGVGLFFIVLGIVRLVVLHGTVDRYVFGAIGIALGVAMLLRGLDARKKGRVV